MKKIILEEIIGLYGYVCIKSIVCKFYFYHETSHILSMKNCLTSHLIDSQAI